MNNEWQDLFTYETVCDAPNVGAILVGTIGICLGIVTIVLLIGVLL